MLAGRACHLGDYETLDGYRDEAGVEPAKNMERGRRRQQRGCTCPAADVFAEDMVDENRLRGGAVMAGVLTAALTRNIARHQPT